MVFVVGAVLVLIFLFSSDGGGVLYKFMVSASIMGATFLIWERIQTAYEKRKMASLFSK